MIFKLQFRRLNKGVNLTFKLWCKYTAHLYIILHNNVILLENSTYSFKYIHLIIVKILINTYFNLHISLFNYSFVLCT